MVVRHYILGNCLAIAPYAVRLRTVLQFRGCQACESALLSTSTRRSTRTAGPDVAWPFLLEAGRCIRSPLASPTKEVPRSWRHTCVPLRWILQLRAGRFTVSWFGP